MKNQDSPQSALAKLPFSQMLGDPVRACVRAQVEAAQVTKRYLNSVTLRQNEAGYQEAVMVSFRYQNGERMLELSIPLMTLVPIPHFSVDRLDIEFNALVESFDEKHLTCSFAGTDTQHDGEEQQTITSNHHLKVKLQATQDHMPIGLSKLLGLLDEAIVLDQPIRPSAKADLRLNAEKIEIFTKREYQLYPSEPIVPEALVWSSSNPFVATVDERGLVRAHQEGEAYIFVETYEARGRCRVIVESDQRKLGQILSSIKEYSQRREASQASQESSSYVGSYKGGISSNTKEGYLDGSYGMKLISRANETENTRPLDPRALRTQVITARIKAKQTKIPAFHVTHTAPARARGQEPHIDDFELLTTIMSALQWRRHNGPIKLYTDSEGKRIYEEQNMTFIWDGGMDTTVLDTIQDRVDFSIFWAGGKLYALRDMQCPCVMLDTDMVVWKSLDEKINPKKDAVACVHKEYLSEVYPSIDKLKTAKGYRFEESWSWSAEPFNTALLYIADPKFKELYTSHAIEFMRDNLERANDDISQMVFAEQRLLGICGENTNTPIKTLLELEQLHEQDMITHIWGGKASLRQSPELAETFCREMVAKLLEIFDELSIELLDIPVVKQYQPLAI